MRLESIIAAVYFSLIHNPIWLYAYRSVFINIMNFNVGNLPSVLTQEQFYLVAKKINPPQDKLHIPKFHSN